MESEVSIENLFSAILEATQANDVAKIFSLAIIVAFFWFLYLQYKRPGHDFRSEASTILTSLGVTGTFVGILVALQNFDLDQMSSSIGQMLDGLKIAFVTSVLGISFSVLFQIFAPAPRQWGRERGQEKEEYTDRTVSDLYQVLKESLEAQRDLSQQIGGDNDSSLTGQIQKMRLSQVDFNKDLFRKLDEFAEEMSKGATEQIIEALKNVITDFNNKLTEQFGENFKQLNEAVFKLVEWQENYKQQLEEMKVAFDISVKAIEQSRISLDQIVRSSQAIPEAMDKLSPILETVNHQISDLEGHLAAFAQMRDSAVTAIPEIQNHVKALIDDIASATTMTTSKVEELAVITESTFSTFEQTATTASTQLEASTKEATNNIVDLATNISEKTASITESMLTASKEIQTTISSGQEEIQSSFVDMAKTITDTQTEGVAQLQQSLSENIEQLQTQFTEMLRSITDDHRDGAKELRESLETNIVNLQLQFSEMLTSITEKQNEAASQLTDSIRDGVDGIETSLEAAGSKITESTTQSVERLQVQFNSALESLTEHQSIAQTKITDKAEEFSRTIQDKLVEVQTALSESAQNLTEQHNSTSETLGKAGRDIEQSVSKSTEQLQVSVEQISARITESLIEAQNSVTQHTESVANRMDEVARQHFDAVNQSIEQAGGSIRSLMETQFGNFGEGIQDSVERIVQELGEGLTRISRELVKDINELKEVTQALKSQRDQERDNS